MEVVKHPVYPKLSVVVCSFEQFNLLGHSLPDKIEESSINFIQPALPPADNPTKLIFLFDVHELNSEQIFD